MKSVIFASACALLSVSAFARGQTIHVPTGACLEKISAKVEAQGISTHEEENKIDLEDVLSVKGNTWKVLYYKILPEDPRTLGITGVAKVRLDITRAVRDGEYLEVTDCRVYSAKILSEKRN